MSFNSAWMSREDGDGDALAVDDGWIKYKSISLRIFHKWEGSGLTVSIFSVSVSNISGEGGVAAAPSPLPEPTSSADGGDGGALKRRRRCVSNSWLRAFHCWAFKANFDAVSGWRRRDLYSDLFCPCIVLQKYGIFDEKFVY